MKLMSPWRNNETSFERCRATSLKPSLVNTGSSVPGFGDANSTNSNPIRPIGLSNRSAIPVLHANGSDAASSVDPLELRAVARAALDVAGGGAFDAGDFLVAQRPRQLGRCADDERSLGK